MPSMKQRPWQNRNFLLGNTLLVFKLFSLMALFFSTASYAQWPASSNIENSMFVCPGFLTGIVTFEDGSSIILGAYSQYIYAQKLDAFGYKQWSSPVLVHNNADSHIGAGQMPLDPWGAWIDDGDGGVILFWYDQRGSYTSQYVVRNNSIYAQRVDKLGAVRWQPGGVRVKGPESGLKLSAGIADDGQGGCVIEWVDEGFSFPGAPNKSRVTLQRISLEGSRLWEINIDSSDSPQSFYYRKLSRVQDRFLVQYWGGPFALIDLSGNRMTASFTGPFGASTVADSTIYDAASWVVDQRNDTTIYRTVLRRLTKDLDTVFVGEFQDFAFGEFMNNPTPVVPDGKGGVYAILAFSERDSTNYWTGYLHLQHYDGNTFWNPMMVLKGADRPFAARDDAGGIVVANVLAGSYTQRYVDGQALWPEPVPFVSSLYETENLSFAGDQNGGMIMAFWRITGGIYAQHSGRDGKVGVLTSVQSRRAPASRANLFQNYPNPFNGVTKLRFSVPERTVVRLTTFDVLGRKVHELVNSVLEQGEYSVDYDARGLSSGIYFFELTTATHRQLRKMLLLK